MQLESFKRLSEVAVIVSFWFEDIEERWTFEFTEEGSDTERGEMVDFPWVTIVARGAQWEMLRDRARQLAVRFEDHREQLERRYGQRALTEAMRERLEALRGTIEVDLDGLQLKVVLNDYVEEQGAPRFKVSLSQRALEELLSGQIEPRALGQKVSIEGQMGLALALGGLLIESFGL